MSFAFLFPGQGAQSHNIIDKLKDESIINKTFEEASDAIKINLLKLLETNDDSINITSITQPLLLTVGVAVYRLYKELGGKNPTYVTGHSLGEFTALTVAESLNFVDAVKLVNFRGLVMQESIEQDKGAMAAILGISHQEVIDLCKEISSNGVVEAVNFNSPEQVVIAGERKLVLDAIEKSKKLGAKKSILLNVSVPSHCILMKEASIKLAEKLNNINIAIPRIAVIHNFDVKIHSDLDSIKNALIKQLYSPVKWLQIIEYLVSNKIEVMTECSPSKVLVGLNRRINKNIVNFNFMDTQSINDFINKNN